MIKTFLVIYCIFKGNKTHYKVSHFPPVNPNPNTLPIAAYLPMSPAIGKRVNEIFL